MKPFTYVIPATVDEALAALRATPDATVKAGGIDLLDRLKEGTASPSTIVSLHHVGQLRGVRAGEDGLAIGPLVTLAELAENASVRSHSPALAEAAASAANPQIRNVATVGGNLLQRPRCPYFRALEFVCLKKGGSTCFAAEGDNRWHAILGGGPSYIVHPSTVATALVALDARVRLRGSSDGQHREIALGDFFVLPRVKLDGENVLAPGELLVEIVVPNASVRSHYVVAKERSTFDWPLAEVAVALELDGSTVKKARVVLGAAAPIPWRATKAEAALVGKSLAHGSDAARAAAKAALDGARPLAGNGYKLPLFEALALRAIVEASS